MAKVSVVLALVAALVTHPPQAPQQPSPNLSPQQFLEQFLLVVAPIEIHCGPSRLGTATGFFFNNDGRQFFVTNRHVLRNEATSFYPDVLRLRLHTNPQDSTQNDYYNLSLYRSRTSTWREKPNVDLAAIEIPGSDMSRFVTKALHGQMLPPSDLVIALGDEVMILGYPRGFSDVLHNYPIARNGAVASPYPVEFQGNPYFLVDARLHPGTSGSPVLAKPGMIWRTSGGTSVTGMTTYFLGVNSSEIGFGGESSGLNTIWYASEVKEITSSTFRSATFPQP
jgi:S1-C subfamily serine protease